MPLELAVGAARTESRARGLPPDRRAYFRVMSRALRHLPSGDQEQIHLFYN